jgi:hypothetical protein
MGLLVSVQVMEYSVDRYLELVTAESLTSIVDFLFEVLDLLLLSHNCYAVSIQVPLMCDDFV